MGKKGKPRVAREPPARNSVRSQFDLSGTDNHSVVWALSGIDVHGPWGLAALKEIDVNEFLGHLKGLESMTWAEILRAAGGRREGNNSHPIALEGLSKAANRRLEELALDDVESIFSFRLKQGLRLYGIRDRRVCKLLWLDPWHTDNSRCVVPTAGR